MIRVDEDEEEPTTNFIKANEWEHFANGVMP